MNNKDWAEFDKTYPGLIDPKKIDSTKLQAGDKIVYGWESAYGVVVSVPMADKAITSWDKGFKNPTVKMHALCGYRLLIGDPARYLEVTAELRETQAAAWRAQYGTRTDPSDMPDADEQVKEWQDLGLCPKIDGKTLVWKVVNMVTKEMQNVRRAMHATSEGTDPVKIGDYVGMLWAPYEVGATYLRPFSMATAGPIGAIKGYANKDGCYLLGILADRLTSDPSRKDGAFYMPDSFTVVSAYRVDEIVYKFGGDVEIVTSLIEGDLDAMRLIAG